MSKKLLVIVSLAMYMTACGTDKKEVADGQVKASYEEANTEGVKADAQATAQLGEFDKLMAAYYDLKNALVASDPVKAKEAAGQVENKASEDMNEIIKGATLIQESDELEQMHKPFELISDSMYKLVKEQEMSQPVYRQYCPMAFDNQGAYWLSSEKEIRNPYFGNKMLKCGRVEEEI